MVAALLDRFKWFPVTRGQLTMLLEGNTCDSKKTFEQFNLISGLHTFLSQKDDSYINILPTLSLLVDKDKQFDKMLLDIKKYSVISIDLETTSLDPLSAEIVGMSLSVKEDNAYYIPFISIFKITFYIH